MRAASEKGSEPNLGGLRTLCEITKGQFSGGSFIFLPIFFFKFQIRYGLRLFQKYVEMLHTYTHNFSETFYWNFVPCELSWKALLFGGFAAQYVGRRGWFMERLSFSPCSASTRDFCTDFVVEAGTANQIPSCEQAYFSARTKFVTECWLSPWVNLDGPSDL